MRISQRLSQVKPSATMAVSAKAMELKAQGKDIISLSVGEPDFCTPAYIRDAAKTALDDCFTRYTQVPAIPELRTAGADYFARYYATKAEADNIIFTNGGKQALYNLMQCLLNPGDKVLIPSPYWVSYPAMVTLAEAESVFVESSPADGFKISVEDLEAAWDHKTRMLILNSPSNPTGVHYTSKELTSIVEWAVAKDVFVISDEIYDRLVYAPSEPFSLAPLWEKHPEHIAVVNGLSKSYAMTGWRVGFCLAHAELIKMMSKIQGQSTSNICSIAQKAALAALNGPDDFVEEMRTAFASRREKALEIVASWPDVVCPEPDGAFYIFPDVSALYSGKIPDSTTACTYLLEHAGVAAVPGAAFGDDRCIRFSYALAEDALISALVKVGETLAGNSG